MPCPLTYISRYNAPISGQEALFATSYRFSFNGMEKDDEVKGLGNSLDFGARVYDSRLGRWLSPDAFEKKYPHLSTYCAMGDNPNLFVDPDGNDIIIYGRANNGKFYPVLTIITSEYNITKYVDVVVKLNDNEIPVPSPTFLLPSIPNVDGYLGSIGVDFAFGGGVGGALQIGIIQKGKDQGVFFYKTFNTNMGMGAGAGGSFGPVDFNEESGQEFNRYTYTGLSQGYSIGIGTFGYSSWTSYVNGETCGPFEDCGPILYTAEMVSGSAGPADYGAMYSFSKSAIIENWSIPMRLSSIEVENAPPKTSAND